MGRRRNSSAVLLLLYVGIFCLQARVLFSMDQSCSSVDLKALEGFVKGLDSVVISGLLFNCSSSSSSSTNCCEWRGVTCSSSSSLNSTGRVVELDFSNMGIKGSISNSLADLDQLKKLSLSNNTLGGTVPPGLLRLRQLQILDISQNNLSGVLSPDSYLPSIEYFNISFNGFIGSHPVLNGSTNLIKFDISNNKFYGHANASICSASPRIQILYLSANQLYGDIPLDLGNCTSLQKLGLDSNDISGSLADDLFRLSSLAELYLQNNRFNGTLNTGIGNLSNLVRLDISSNSFTGSIPDVFIGLRMLQFLSAESNCFTGRLPASLSNLTAIQVLNLRNNSFEGGINLGFSTMPRLSFLDLGSNKFSGSIPPDLSSCVELKTVNLARNMLQGGIPEGFRNLSALSFLSVSNNSLTGISSALGILQHSPHLTGLVLTMNFHGEKMPSDGIQGFKNLQLLVIANCHLVGYIPTWLDSCHNLQLVDLSWNQLYGDIPSWFGDLDSLFYLDLSNNSLVGEIPQSLTNMKSLVYQSRSQRGSSPADFPFFSKQNHRSKGLQYNQLNGFPPSLILSNNKLVGPIWPQFGNLKKLHVLDLSNNNLTGIIPKELSGTSSLEILDLSHNELTGSIPSSLNKLTFLSRFSVANNDLVGPIPDGAQFSTFPNSSFEGNLGLCGEHLSPCLNAHGPTETVGRRQKSKGVIIGMASGIGCGAAFVIVLIYLVVTRTHSSRRVENTEKDASDFEECLDSSKSRLVLLFQNKDNKELTIDDILKATNSFDQANIIGCGGFGLVYKAILPDGKKVAIKRLSGDYGQMEREFRAEVEALSQAQHKNLVLLQGYCRVGNDRLLIYSYMENGSLDYWLHEKLDEGCTLDWGTRLQIAQGAAKGLAYLHQSCQPHILHRDVKSSNILLDEHFEAHLADFGLARFIRPYDTHVTTDLVGTLGYIPPEYGQASVATFKGDVYSFGVVLLELLTGRRPMDLCKLKGSRDLISWVFQMRKEKRETEIFDPHIYEKQYDKQLLQVLEVACLCLSECPKMRPLTQQIVLWLDDIGINDRLTN